ncbi:hypothetical protein PFISCL1PPCAC_7208, partial [Pristionchus fissidentatus]
KILVYNPTIGHSQSNFMGRIADILTEAGHDVTTLVSMIDPDVSDGTKLSKIIRVPPCAETKLHHERKKIVKPDLFSMNDNNPIGAYFMGKFFGKYYSNQCKALLEEPGLVERLTAEKFDVFFAEHHDMCGVGLAHVFKPKSFISVSASVIFGLNVKDFGFPALLSSSPAMFVSKMEGRSIWERLAHIYEGFLLWISSNANRNLVHDVFKDKFGADFPEFDKISSESAFVFINSEPFIDYDLPSMNKVISIGGIGVKEAKQLSEDWVNILTKRDNTVLLSFGSVAKSAYLLMEIKLSIIETVKALPHVTFIWKYEEDDEFTKNIASKVNNLVITKWMPQSDLLGHHRLSAFITHGGMGSTQETALRGV